MLRRSRRFVCTKFQKTNTITRLRNYTLPSSADRRVTIVEAALATSAAPTYFSPMAIDGMEYVDGVIGANNPAVEVEEEASDVWCEQDGNLKPLVKCFISIGTGHPGITTVSERGLKNLMETLKQVRQRPITRISGGWAGGESTSKMDGRSDSMSAMVWKR